MVLIDQLPYVVGADTLTPWLTPEEMLQAGFEGLKSVHYSERLRITLAEDTKGMMHALDARGDWYHAGRSTNAENYIDGVFDLQNVGATLILGSNFVDLVRESSEPGFETERIATRRLIGSDWVASKELSQLLWYGPSEQNGKPAWLRRTLFGFDDIPGGQTGRSADQNLNNSSSLMARDLHGRGQVLIFGQDQLYLYDGRAMTPVIGGTYADLGGVPNLIDLPAIDRVFLKRGNLLFDLSINGAVSEVPERIAALVNLGLYQNWPAARAVLVAANAGVFSLDHDLHIERVADAEMAFHEFAQGIEVSATGDLVLQGERNLIVAVDGRKNPGSCQFPN